MGSQNGFTAPLWLSSLDRPVHISLHEIPTTNVTKTAAKSINFIVLNSEINGLKYVHQLVFVLVNYRPIINAEKYSNVIM